MTTSKEFDKAEVNGKDGADGIQPQSSSNGAVETNGQPITYEAQIPSQFKAIAKPAPQSKTGSFWQNLSLRTKATVIAVAIGVIPVLGVGLFDAIDSSNAVIEEEYQEQQSRAANLKTFLTQFVQDKYQSVQGLASTPFLTNPELGAAVTAQEQIKYFEQFLVNGVESIVLVDAKTGAALLEARLPNTKPTQPEYNNIDYFQAVKATKRPVINPVRKSTTTGLSSFFVAAPVFNSQTGELQYVIRTRTQASYIDQIIRDNVALREASEEHAVKYLVTDAQGRVFASENPEDIEKTLGEFFPTIADSKSNQAESSIVTSTADNEEYLVASASLQGTEELPIQNWKVVVAESAETLYQEQRSQTLSLFSGTLVATLMAIVLSTIVARRATRPIVESAQAVEKIGQGKFNTRLAITGQDELATLGSSINQMAEQLQALSQAQEEIARIQVAEARQALLFGEIARARREEELKEPLTEILAEVRQALGTDRVVVYRFYPNGSGYIAAEDVLTDWPSALGDVIEDPCIPKELLEDYKQGRVVPTSNVYEAGFHPDHLQLVKRLKIKANLVTPIVQGEDLYGLLIAHHCANTHEWQQPEIEYLVQTANQLGLALNGFRLLEIKEAEAQQQRLQAEQSRLVAETQSKILMDAARSRQIDVRFYINQFVPLLENARIDIKADRIVIYEFDENWKGTVVAEAVGEKWPRALGALIHDPCFAESYVEKYQQGRVKATANIYEAGLTECHLKQLEPFAVKANLVTPIRVNEKLVALLIAHQCSGPRFWQQSEIDYLTQLSSQLSVAFSALRLLETRQAEAEQQRQQKEDLQRELLQLITNVEGASSGDLTVRAEISAGEIGIIADFFNAIIENLRELVNQIKQAATQVNSSVGSNESAIGALAEEAIGQANQITQTLTSVERMALSIQEVANNAQAAATVARTASTTAETGGEAMDKTVESILQLRETIAETAKKVKRLGESSQQISKAVSLINQIALKTNLLAVNASIEAARAGEEGRGFAVVAEEVGELAAQSATATKEIEQLVANIQRETSQVVEAMEQGTTEVVEGTRMVAQTKKSLEKIVDVSRQIDQLLQSISNATVSQAQTSQSVTRLMEEIAQVSERTSDASRQISSSLQQTSAITQQLQESVETFKVE